MPKPLPLILFLSLSLSVKATTLHHTWHKGCPTPIKDLRYLKIPYWGFDKKPHLGELIVHQALAKEVVEIFHLLYVQKFPIERMELMDKFKGNDEASMKANNTSAFNCRALTGHPGIYSQHSYGRAIDINPRINPYVDGKKILPANGRRFSHRQAFYPGMITKNSWLYKAFTRRGWDWAGNWYDVQDYQHFEKRARGKKRNPYGY